MPQSQLHILSNNLSFKELHLNRSTEIVLTYRRLKWVVSWAQRGLSWKGWNWESEISQSKFCCGRTLVLFRPKFDNSWRSCQNLKPKWLRWIKVQSGVLITNGISSGFYSIILFSSLKQAFWFDWKTLMIWSKPSETFYLLGYLFGRSWRQTPAITVRNWGPIREY